MTSAVGLRTHRAGELSAEDIGTEVVLCGWVATRRDHGGVAFVDLRDASGIVQVVIHDEAVAHPLRSEFCLRITGTVTRRPEGNDNPNLATGQIEVEASAVEVLSPSTARVDRTLKFDRYRTAGTPSYWIVDPEKRSITRWDFVNVPEEPVTFTEHSFESTAFPGVRLDVASTFAD